MGQCEVRALAHCSGRPICVNGARGCSCLLSPVSALLPLVSCLFRPLSLLRARQHSISSSLARSPLFDFTLPPNTGALSVVEKVLQRECVTQCICVCVSVFVCVCVRAANGIGEPLPRQNWSHKGSQERNEKRARSSSPASPNWPGHLHSCLGLSLHQKAVYVRTISYSAGASPRVQLRPPASHLHPTEPRHRKQRRAAREAKRRRAGQ